jgi:hypothetical protein
VRRTLALLELDVVIGVGKHFLGIDLLLLQERSHAVARRGAPRPLLDKHVAMRFVWRFTGGYGL